MYQYLYKKINEEMRIIYITQTKPKKKIRLDPLQPQNINIDLQAVSRWSQNNKQLYQLLLNNGMAEFICNRQFINEHYRHIQFMYSGIHNIDSDCLKLVNLKVLNLFHNKIAVLENIPTSCVELYIDFNCISDINIKNSLNLQLLSISNNKINDKAFNQILKRTPLLRCLNIANNQIEDIRKFVTIIKNYSKIKILIAKNNPIGVLALYWDYITKQIALDFFDNQKYVKPQQTKQKQVPKQQIKQQKKEQKKDTKKDTKKNTKVQQKPIEQQKKAEQKPVGPKVYKQQDYMGSSLRVQIGVFQNFSGTVYDSSIFPQQNLNLKQTQSCFWAQIQIMGKKVTNQQTKIPMDSILQNEESNRLNFQFVIQQQIKSTYQNFLRLKQGAKIFIYKSEPIVQLDAESGQQKVNLDNQKSINMKIQCIGGLYVNLQPLTGLKKKQIIMNYNIFAKQAAIEPLFRKPYENQNELIFKNKAVFDTKLAALQQQKKKKMQQQQQNKLQKKGGKDTKKAPAKKQTKKQGKQTQGQKKPVQKCNFPLDTQQYRYLGQQKMYKCLKQRVGVRVNIV